LQRVELLLQGRYLPTGLHDVVLQRSYVVINGRAVIPSQGCGEVADRAGRIVEQAETRVVRCIHW
jgi:hypothetical protein